jgi:hypothetical protein
MVELERRSDKSEKRQDPFRVREIILEGTFEDLSNGNE